MKTQTAHHTYTLHATLQIWRNGAQLQNVDVDTPDGPVTVPDLAPGNYDLYLNWGGSLHRDGGAPIAATLGTANPWPVTVAAGETLTVPLTFSVAGDPPEPPEEEPGALELTFIVNEVPPA